MVVLHRVVDHPDPGRGAPSRSDAWSARAKHARPSGGTSSSTRSVTRTGQWGRDCAAIAVRDARATGARPSRYRTGTAAAGRSELAFRGCGGRHLGMLLMDGADCCSVGLTTCETRRHDLPTMAGMLHYGQAWSGCGGQRPMTRR